MANNPLVIVGIPVRNCEATIGVCIRSILSQTYPDWELLVIDDGSTDKTLAVVRQFTDPRIKVFVDGEWKGISARRNQTLKTSVGKYYACMDGDDVAYPYRFEAQVKYLEENSGVNLVGAWMLVFGAGGKPIGRRVFPEDHATICARPWAGFPLAQPTFMGRLEWFRRYFYDESMVRSDDQDLLLRSYLSSRFANIQDVLIGYREEKLFFKKRITERRFLALALAREFRRQGKLGLATRAVFGQMIKASLDCVAIASGLNYRLLRHRARFVTQQERQKWLEIWRLVNQEMENVQD